MRAVQDRLDNAEEGSTQGNSGSAGDAADGEAEAVKIEGKAQADFAKTLTKAYLQYEAFDGDATIQSFVPIGKDGMSIIVNAKSSRR